MATSNKVNIKVSADTREYRAEMEKLFKINQNYTQKTQEYARRFDAAMKQNQQSVQQASKLSEQSLQQLNKQIKALKLNSSKGLKEQLSGIDIFKYLPDLLEKNKDKIADFIKSLPELDRSDKTEKNAKKDKENKPKSPKKPSAKEQYDQMQKRVFDEYQQGKIGINEYQSTVAKLYEHFLIGQFKKQSEKYENFFKLIEERAFKASKKFKGKHGVPDHAVNIVQSLGQASTVAKSYFKADADNNYRYKIGLIKEKQAALEKSYQVELGYLNLLHKRNKLEKGSYEKEVKQLTEQYEKAKSELQLASKIENLSFYQQMSANLTNQVLAQRGEHSKTYKSLMKASTHFGNLSTLAKEEGNLPQQKADELKKLDEQYQKKELKEKEYQAKITEIEQKYLALRLKNQATQEAGKFALIQDSAADITATLKNKHIGPPILSKITHGIGQTALVGNSFYKAMADSEIQVTRQRIEEEQKLLASHHEQQLDNLKKFYEGKKDLQQEYQEKTAIVNEQFQQARDTLDSQSQLANIGFLGQFSQNMAEVFKQQQGENSTAYQLTSGVSVGINGYLNYVNGQEAADQNHQTKKEQLDAQYAEHITKHQAYLDEIRILDEKSFGCEIYDEMQRTTLDEKYQQNLEMHQEYLGKVSALDTDNLQKKEKMEKSYQAATLGLLSNVTGKMAEKMKQEHGENSKQYKVMFAASKAFAIAQAIINVELAATQDIAKKGIWGIPASTLIRTMGYASIAMMAAQSISGMAHNGMDFIPSEGTWLLDRGERVVDARTNADLKGFLDKRSNKSDGHQIVVNNYSGQEVSVRELDDQTIIDIAAERGAEAGYNRVVSDLNNRYGSISEGLRSGWNITSRAE